MQLEFEQISYRYRGQDQLALSGVSGKFPPGSVTGIFGANGSGKSTLLHCLAGVLTPSAGTVRLNGRQLQTYSRLELARHIALAAQENPAGCTFTVRELTALGTYPWEGKRREAVETALTRCGLQALAERRFDSLSGGEKRRTLLARALAQCDRLLLLDEPAAHLDPGWQWNLYELLRRLAADGVTVIMNCHDLVFAPGYLDRALLLKDGEVVEEGEPRQVLAQENILRAFGRPLPAPTLWIR